MLHLSVYPKFVFKLQSGVIHDSTRRLWAGAVAASLTIWGGGGAGNVNSQVGPSTFHFPDDINSNSLRIKNKEKTFSAEMQIISLLFPYAIIYMYNRDETIPKTRRDALPM